MVGASCRGRWVLCAAAATVLTVAIGGSPARADEQLTLPPIEPEPPDHVGVPDVGSLSLESEDESESATASVDIEDVLKSSVYVASKRPQQVRESPAVISLVTHEQTTRYGWNSLNDVLYRQPGFAVARDYERRVVAGRGQFEGWNNNHLLLLVDGVPFNDNLYGTAFTW